jgi:hypothetical protein
MALGGFGCSTVRTNQPAGAACVRSAECEPGLACVANMCSNDLSSLAEAGTLPPLDLGSPVDGGVIVDDLGVDSGSAPSDMGAAPDLGMTPVDMGPPPVDMGPAAIDLGTVLEDLGTPDIDSGVPDPDAG